MVKKLLCFSAVIIFIAVLLPDIVEAARLRLSLYYDNGEILWDEDIQQRIQYYQDLYFVEPERENNYTVAVYSFEETVLKRFKRDLQPDVWYENFDQETGEVTGGGFQMLSEGPTTVDIPYYSNAAKVRIFDSANKIVFSADISSFAVCNKNNRCEPGEDTENCPSDCQKKAGFAWILSVIIFGAAVIIAISTIYFIKRRRKTIS